MAFPACLLEQAFRWHLLIDWHRRNGHFWALSVAFCGLPSRVCLLQCCLLGFSLLSWPSTGRHRVPAGIILRHAGPLNVFEPHPIGDILATLYPETLPALAAVVPGIGLPIVLATLLTRFADAHCVTLQI